MGHGINKINDDLGELRWIERAREPREDIGEVLNYG